MGKPAPPESGLLLLSAFSQHTEAIEWAKGIFDLLWGPLALESPPLPFGETRYYEPSMGADLQICILCSASPLASDALADVKLWTNRLEEIYAENSAHPEIRPLNLDPGCLTSSKFVLATTKDASHRIHLHSGIFAEVTLVFEHGAWRTLKWTYPNYRRDDYRSFLDRCRQFLLQARKS